MMSALVLRRFLPVFTLALLCALAVAQVGFSGSAQGAPLPTGNIAVREGDNAGEVVVSWDAVPQATHYRIGYVNMEVDYLLATASCTGEWIEAFIYVDVNARNILVNSDGRAEYTIRRLSPEAAHAFTVLTSNDFVDTGGGESVSSEFFWPPKGSRWARLPGRNTLPEGITLPTGECTDTAAGQTAPPSTGNIAVREGDNEGEVAVSWDAVSQATYYRIGYVNMEVDYFLATNSCTKEWIEAFIYVDVNARNIPVNNDGRAEYTIRRLSPGAAHAFTVLTSNDFVDTGGGESVSSEFFWPPKGSRWERLAGRDTLPDGITLPTGECYVPGAVAIPDPLLRAAIEEALGKSPGEPITAEEMATLEELHAVDPPGSPGYVSLEGLQHATNLIDLRINNGRPFPTSLTDLSPLSGLAKLTGLTIWYVNISDLSPLSGLTELTELDLFCNNISDLSPLSGLTQLEWVILRCNKISDLSPLSGLTELQTLDLSINNISDLAPLVANTGLGRGDEINVDDNPLDDASVNTHIPALRARGVDFGDGVVVACDPDSEYYIHNDNLFVFPVPENLVTDELLLQFYTACFYQHFEDEFDFLMFLSNLRPGEARTYDGVYHQVRNDTAGIGQQIYSSVDRWSAGEKLQGVIHLSDYRGIEYGPSLHELMHQWANYIIPSVSYSHWGVSSADGQLGGFDIDNLVDHGNGRYSAGRFGVNSNGGNSVPYSPIELYLAGFIPPEEVPDLLVAEDAEPLEYPMFSASGFTTYTIEDIIAEHGPRVPDSSQAQHDFRAAAILLIDENHPAIRRVLESVSAEVSRFSYPGVDDDDSGYNFYEATGGKGTMSMDGLSQFRKTPASATPAAGAVVIPDPLLRTAIEEALGKAPGEPITADEMATLTELVPDYPGHPGYSSLEGLQYATNMTTLELRNESPFEGKLTDLSPLSGLTKLTNLTIWFSNVSDLSPLSGLTELTHLNLFWSNISDVSPLSSLTELTYLSLRSNNVADLSPLSNLVKLTDLDLSYNVFFDISSLSNLTGLTQLNLSFNNVSDLSPLSNLTGLIGLDLDDNNISDLSPLSSLTGLTRLYLENNNISNLAPLVANAGLGLGDEVYVVGNPFDDASINTYVPALQARGVAIDGKLDVDKLQCPDSENYRIHNDNLFALSVTQHLVTEEPPIQYYVTCFYRYYEDEFDFLMLLDNVGDDEDITLPYHGIYASVRNDVEGIGQRIYSPGDRWGAVEKLQGVMHFPKAGYMRSGPTLHELMHRWANYVVPSTSYSHWGFSSADGQLGGFDIDNLINHGDGRYSAGDFGPFANGGNRVPYSPIELYLAGFIPPEDVPDLWVAEDGEWLDSEDGAPVLDDNGFGMFTASRVRTYSIEDIIAEHGPRVPESAHAQHDFRAAAILLTDEDHPATEEILDLVSSDVAWFSHPGNDDHYLSNFFEATGGKGTMAMDGLSQFRKKP